jgi:hypothetical protein
LQEESVTPNDEQSTANRQPPLQPSEEADQQQLDLAKKQGEVYGQALEAMGKETGQIESRRVGDYEVLVTAEDAEGMWELRYGQLEWMEPTDANCHIEVVVRDAADGRFVPELPISVTVYDERGQEIGSHPHQFIWHPWLYHYGRNWHIPASGSYRVKVEIGAPLFHRHDSINGQRYTRPVAAEFTLRLETGQKHGEKAA